MNMPETLEWRRVDHAPFFAPHGDESMNRVSKFVLMLHELSGESSADST
jgi:hypothetical protein